MEKHDLNVFENNGLDETSKAYLLETTRWTKFLSILGFIFIGFMILFLLIMMVAGSALSAYSPGMETFGVLGAVIVMILLVAFYFYPIYALWKFSTNMKSGINTNNQEQITEGFRYQKNMYRFLGIVAIIILALYLLIFIFGGLGAIFGSMR
jgi:hypothetical protein